jgi:hypothetical protein
MSNATLSNRLAFQTSTTNGNTTLNIIPNGTGTASQYVAHMGSDPANTSRAGININSTQSAALVFSDITGTGTYLPMTFYTGGSERMRIDSSTGNVGIGTASPGTKLDVVVSTNNGLRISDGAVTGVVYASSGPAMVVGTTSNHPTVLYSNNAERMRIDSSGNVGIGTASPASRLDVRTSAAEIGRFSSSAANGGYQVFYPDNVTTPVYVGSQKAILSTGNATDFAIVGTGANNMVFGTNSAERMRIDSSGNVLVNNTAVVGSEKLRVTQSTANQAVFIDITAASSTASPGIRIRKQDNDNTTAQTYMAFDYNAGASGAGGIQGNGGTGPQFFNSSDARLKENVSDLDGQLAKIMALKPRTFDFINGPKGCTGFIAQEMEEIYPDAIGETPDGYKTIGGVSVMEARLIKAIQELSAKVAALEAK